MGENQRTAGEIMISYHYLERSTCIFGRKNKFLRAAALMDYRLCLVVVKNESKPA